MNKGLVSKIIGQFTAIVFLSDAGNGAIGCLDVVGLESGLFLIVFFVPLDVFRVDIDISFDVASEAIDSFRCT